MHKRWWKPGKMSLLLVKLVVISDYTWWSSLNNYQCSLCNSRVPCICFGRLLEEAHICLMQVFELGWTNPPLFLFACYRVFRIFFLRMWLLLGAKIRQIWSAWSGQKYLAVIKTIKTTFLQEKRRALLVPSPSFLYHHPAVLLWILSVLLIIHMV